MRWSGEGFCHNLGRLGEDLVQMFLADIALCVHLVLCFCSGRAGGKPAPPGDHFQASRGVAVAMSDLVENVIACEDFSGNGLWREVFEGGFLFRGSRVVHPVVVKEAVAGRQIEIVCARIRFRNCGYFGCEEAE